METSKKADQQELVLVTPELPRDLVDWIDGLKSNTVNLSTAIQLSCSFSEADTTSRCKHQSSSQLLMLKM